jgi:cell division septum initiation protein DivIVA
VDSLALIERLDQLVAEAKPIPLTREARIDRDEVYKLLDRIRTTLPVEFERARWLGREDDHEENLEAQLQKIGASISELRRVQRAQAERPDRPPLTAAAADRVQEIIEAAERTAAELEQQAGAEAQRMKEEAEAELRAAREESERLRRESRERAAGEAAAYLRRVEEATKKMLERADAADSEINGMLARLRGSGGSVIEDLEAIMAGLAEIEVRRNEQRRAGAAQAAERVGAEAPRRPARRTVAASPPAEGRPVRRLPSRRTPGEAGPPGDARVQGAPTQAATGPPVPGQIVVGPPAAARAEPQPPAEASAAPPPAQRTVRPIHPAPPRTEPPSPPRPNSGTVRRLPAEGGEGREGEPEPPAA